MNLTRLPIAVALFAQWRQARGRRTDPATRPFSRHWEQLLEDARIVSAIDREDAERDARSLDEAGWVELKAPRYRPELIERIAIPLERESAWCRTFGFAPPTNEDTRQIREFAWMPALAFVREARLNVGFDELKRIHDFLSGDAASRPLVPIKERSLALFGDEKRLDLLADTALFRDGRLSLEQLRCYIVTEPLGWRRGHDNTGPVLVVENAATWDSFGRWNDVRRLFSAVIYGQGNCFAERTAFLSEIFRELGGVRPIQYFGDLDATGLRIPQRATRALERLGLPAAEPYGPAYEWLLQQAARATPANEDDPARRQDCDWLGPLAEPAWQILRQQRRLAQEHIGWEFLLKLAF